MSRTSWATSARFHSSFLQEEEVGMEKVLTNYGLPPTGFPEDRTPLVSEEIRRCSECEKVRPVGDFYRQVKEVGGEDRVYYSRKCKDCKSYKKKATDSFERELADAPIVAAVRVLDENPEALALLIKYFRPSFTKFYEAEREAVEKRRGARQST